MTPLESFYPRTECLPWSRSILGLNDSLRVVLSQDRTTPLESLYPSIEGLPWSRSIPGQNDPLMCPGSISVSISPRAHFRCLSLSGHHSGAHMCLGTLQVSMCPWTLPVPICVRAPFWCSNWLGYHWSCSIPGQNDSHGVVLSQDRMTTLESFYPRTD